MSADQLSVAVPIEVSVVLPCLNEAWSVGACVHAAWQGIASLGVRGEVIVSDSGSTDASRRIAAHAGARVVRAPRVGYGAALRHGIAAARGTYAIIADSDASYDLTDVARFWDRLQAGDDLVIGNRFQGRIADGAMPFLHRYLGNPMLSVLGRALTDSAVGDFQSGMRAFRTSAIADLQLRADGMEFASEMIAKASSARLRVSEIPIDLGNTPPGRERSHLRPIRDGLRNVKTLIELRH